MLSVSLNTHGSGYAYCGVERMATRLAMNGVESRQRSARVMLFDADLSLLSAARVLGHEPQRGLLGHGLLTGAWTACWGMRGMLVGAGWGMGGNEARPSAACVRIQRSCFGLSRHLGLDSWTMLHFMGAHTFNFLGANTPSHPVNRMPTSTVTSCCDLLPAPSSMPSSICTFNRRAFGCG